MKLVNYKRGYIFDCSIHGTIYMTWKEWSKAFKWLKMQRKPFQNDMFYKRIFYDDVANRICTTKNRCAINIRVPATEALVKHFSLKGYKRGNYQIMIDN